MNEPYTLDELKRRFNELGLDHFVTSIEFDECNNATMNVSINLQLIKPAEGLDVSVHVEGDTPEERFNRAMAVLDAK